MTAGEVVFVIICFALYAPLFRLLDRMTWDEIRRGLRGLGRVPLLRVDGLLDQVDKIKLEPFGQSLAGLEIVASPYVPKGELYYAYPKLVGHPLDVLGGLVRWEGPCR